jgi:hypothetical protein
MGGLRINAGVTIVADAGTDTSMLMAVHGFVTFSVAVHTSDAALGAEPAVQAMFVF